jgi:hypothetical protein
MDFWHTAITYNYNKFNLISKNYTECVLLNFFLKHDRKKFLALVT